MRMGADEAVGAILNGKWKLVRVVGEGGVAAVYEADGLQGQGKRAIKLLHRHFQSQPSIVERFYKEAKACFSLRHPHVASVEAYAYAEDGSPYLVMELLHGMSLHDYLLKKQPMSAEQAAPILYGILQALSVAHARGIIHRELKPENLFLVSDDKGEFVVKVLDFGIAKVMDLAGGMGTKTRTGAVLGTPGYMSPEQVRNAKAVDARSDLWAAGVVFYEMLACEHPYTATDQLSRMIAVLKDPHKPISEVNPALANWDPFFVSALARDPAERPQSAQEMAEQLRVLSQGTPARFVPDGMQTVAIPLMPHMLLHAISTPSAEPAGSAEISTGPGTPQGAVGQVAVGQVAVGQPAVGQAPMVGELRPSGTQISADKPDGTPTLVGHTPHVRIETASGPEAMRIVWWGAALIGVAGFAAGFVLGYLL